MKDYRTMRIGEVVTDLPQAMQYFKELGIDYCCGGFRQLDQVLEELNQDKDSVYAKLEEMQHTMQPTKTFDAMNVNELCDYIVNKHHVYVRKALPIINDYLNALMRAHGANHPELFTIGSEFGRLSADLQQHLIKEEELLFPLLKQNDDTSAASLAHIIIDEHEEAGAILAKLRAISNHYTVPRDACGTYVKLYDALQELEDDLHTHIHLENNILLKKLDERK